jgi:hypothetical protein
VKEYESAHDALLKVYDKDPGRIDPVNRHQNWPGWSFAPRFLILVMMLLACPVQRANGSAGKARSRSMASASRRTSRASSFEVHAGSLIMV